MKALRVFQVILGFILLALSIPAEAQQSNKISRIGLLFATSPSAAVSRIQAFQQGLSERGYVEGKNILLEYRYADGKVERVPALARELVGLKSDVIVTNGPTDTRAVKDATKIIPIVMAQDSDPVGSGFVASLARPGGNITGLSTLSPEISGKQVELLKEIDPTLSHIIVVGNSAEPGNAKTLEEMRLAATAVGVQLHYLDLRRREDIESTLANIVRFRAGALIVLRNPIASTSRKRLMESPPRAASLQCTYPRTGSKPAALLPMRWTYVIITDVPQYT